MILLISGATHTGKTVLAQRILEACHIPYISLDLLKMGFIRSGCTTLTPEDDEALTAYMWPIVREMIKTAIENKQHLVIEGGYIPFDWKMYFDESYRQDIYYCCLIMTERYIQNHLDDILQFASVIERRVDDSDCTKERLIAENRHYLAMCLACGCPYFLIDSSYDVDIREVLLTMGCHLL